jgi:Ca-activated chloride channel homolog
MIGRPSPAARRVPLVFFLIAVLLAGLRVPATVRADSGVLIPGDESHPDPAILSLEDMEITVQIQDGDARVFVTEIFASHTKKLEQATYTYALPSNAAVSDFAVWNGPVRIPAVIMENKRAGELYYGRPVEVDETAAEEAARSRVFAAQVWPVQPYGTERIEIKYHETLPVEGFQSYFTIPLQPDAYQAQMAKHFAITFELHSALGIQNFRAPALIFPLQYDANTPHLVKAHFEGDNVRLTQDFTATYGTDRRANDTAQVLTYRKPESDQPSPTEMSPVRKTNRPGFFEVETLLGDATSGAGGAPGATAGTRPKTIVALFDVSLSMQWEKLERSYEALETLLRSLKPTDNFNLILFNTRTQNFMPQPVSVDPGRIERALEFVRASKLRGGTNVEAALDAGLQQCARGMAGSTYLILISDGGATRGPVRNRNIADEYASAWKKLPDAQRPRTYVFGVGDDANAPLLRLLARNDGVFDQVLSTEPLEFKLNAFLSKIGRAPVGDLRLDAPASGDTEMVYSLEDAVYPGSVANWVGRYQQPANNVNFTVRGERDGKAFQILKTADLPQRSLDHPQLPRLWAKARVDALLAKIEQQGEDDAAIAEIIRLSREYKFVTPYTSFLAVPRALLRPRVIRPGDPVLRVKTNGVFDSVVALLPFGLVQRLRYLPDEDVWETRFYVPDDMHDGTYPVRLILRDEEGRVYRETKTFVIASTPPVIRIHLAQTRFRRGETLKLSVSASASTRRLVARLDGAAPVELRWNPQAGSDTGELVVPDQEIPGIYKLTVTGEDIAHNIGSQAVNVEILP